MEKAVTKFRTWQRAASNVTQHMLTKSGVVVPVNACVGSGKTTVACNAFGQFITASKDKKTIQMFVTPRIRLCDQQNNEIKKFLALGPELLHVVLPFLPTYQGTTMGTF